MGVRPPGGGGRRVAQRSVQSRKKTPRVGVPGSHVTGGIMSNMSHRHVTDDPC